jgi:outer membrane protein assembly factor BamB
LPRARMTRHLAVTALACLVVAAAGCGGKYDKPLEVDRQPRLGAYNYAGTYHGFEGAACLSVTGGNLFISYSDAGELRRYYSSGRLVEGVEFRGLVRPTVVGTGRRAIAIADSGADIMVRIYGLSGGDPLMSFSDPDWAEIGGLAVDDSGNVYVSDVKRDFVRCYDAAGDPRFETDLADSGFGIGHVRSPRGIYLNGGTLLIAEADPEKSQVQQIAIDSPQHGVPFSQEVPLISSFTDDDGNELAFLEPVAVATDGDGHVFVLDKGWGKIFRFTADGAADAVVNSPTSGGPETLDGPVAIGTYGEKVFCLDISTGIVHRWDAQ